MISFDAEGRVLSASTSAASALGYEHADDLNGLPLAILVGDSTAADVIDRAAAGAFGEALGPATRDGVRFLRQDGTAITLDAVITPDAAGGWITLVDSASGNGHDSQATGQFTPTVDVAGVLRRLAEQTAKIGDTTEITTRFATELRTATGANAVTVARSSAIAGIYEPMARVSDPATNSLTETIDLPPALVPQQGSGPISVDSLENLALFEPVILYGEEFDGAYICARADLHDGAHLLVIATATGGLDWSEPAKLLLESGVLTLAGTLRATELDRRIASYSRASETVRQIGALASRDHDGGFLDAARKVIGRRLPVSAISIHVADQVTGRCYVPDSSSSGNEEHGALAPGGEWPLAGSIEQRVLQTGSAVFTSAASSERLSVPPATISHWRRSGLQAVVAIPLREAGEVVAIMLAGFSSPVQDPKEVIRLLESIAPAVHLGVGLYAGPGRPVGVPEPDETDADPGFISPALLLDMVRQASESPDIPTLLASVTEWMLEVIPSARVAWGTVNAASGTYRRRYVYGPNGADTVNERPISLNREALATIDAAGIGLAEPGHGGLNPGGMRCAVTAQGRARAVVTVAPHEGATFDAADLSRLHRICEFVSGPLSRLLDTETVKGARARREATSTIGTLAAEFTDAAQAFRSLKSQLTELFPHDRALFVEFESLEGVADVQYDSVLLPGEPTPAPIMFDDLPTRELAETESPMSVAVPAASDASSIFAGYSSLLSIPACTTDGPICALLLLSERPQTITDEQMQLAAELSTHLRGALAGWLAHLVTRDARHRLNDVQKQLSLVLDNTPVAVLTTDSEGICQTIEGHGLDTLHIKRERVLNRSILDRASGLPQLDAVIKQALRGEMATTLTNIGPKTVEIWAQPLTETDGTVKGVALVGYDASDRARSKVAIAEKRQLQETLRGRMEIIENASHDLRNQLQSITAYAEVLAAGAGTTLNESQTHALGVILNTAEKLDKLIGDLPELDYKLTLSEVDVNNMMQDIVDSQEQIFMAAGQSLSINLPETTYSVQADQLRITQVVNNLLSNASKYSPAGASVCIDVLVDGDDLKISVTDDGPGIPADQLERVWDVRTRLDNSITSNVEGSGLGLAIVRKFTEMHGGTASIESEEGVGTTVTVTLPGPKQAGEDGGKAELEAPALRLVDAPAKPKASRTKRRRRSAGG